MFTCDTEAFIVKSFGHFSVSIHTEALDENFDSVKRERGSPIKMCQHGGYHCCQSKKKYQNIGLPQNLIFKLWDRKNIPYNLEMH